MMETTKLSWKFNFFLFSFRHFFPLSPIHPVSFNCLCGSRISVLEDRYAVAFHAEEEEQAMIAFFFFKLKVIKYPTRQSRRRECSCCRTKKEHTAKQAPASIFTPFFFCKFLNQKISWNNHQIDPKTSMTRHGRDSGRSTAISLSDNTAGSQWGEHYTTKRQFDGKDLGKQSPLTSRWCYLAASTPLSLKMYQSQRLFFSNTIEKTKWRREKQEKKDKIKKKTDRISY